MTPTSISTICAWCGSSIGTNPGTADKANPNIADKANPDIADKTIAGTADTGKPGIGDKTSHGICLSCAETYFGLAPEDLFFNSSLPEPPPVAPDKAE
jgi:hypothetical protein